MKKKLVAALAIGVIVFAALPHQLFTIPMPTSADIDSNAAPSSTSDVPHFSVFNDDGGEDDDDDESDDDNGDDEDEEEDDEGDLEANESEDAFNIGSDDNSIEFEKDAPGLSYEWSDAQREASFEMEEYALVEFLDNNQNQLYDAGDEIVYTTGERDDEDDEIDAANEDEDSVWTFSVSVGRDENDTIQNITVTYRFNDSNHEVLFQMFVDRKSGADEIKIDVIINTWTWENETSTLALIGKLEAEMESDAYKGMYNASITRDSQGIYLSLGDTILLEYSWETSVQVDGLEVSLENAAWTSYENETEVDEGEKEMEIELTSQLVYPRFNERLVHDPIMGAVDDANTVSKILPRDANGGIAAYKLLLVGGTIGIVALLVVALFANHRGKTKLETA